MGAVIIACWVAGLAWGGAQGAVNGVERRGVSEDALRRALELEEKRIEVVARVSPAVVSIFNDRHSSGGSGVIIDEQGYGLTNYHVVMGMMNSRRGFGGMSDGELHPLEVLGVDITGDVAMFRITDKDRFVYAPLGDSGGVKRGDPVIAMGNPFSLAEDYTPTVTTGIVTGIHRYQGEGDTLVYTDAIQTDAAINPGNSGGPLFDADGRVIGINGRISAEMHKYARGRFNVGLGYAITINQIKRFIPSLRAGLLAKHGTLLATVVDDVDEVVFNDMYEDAPAWNAGIRVGNRLLRFGDVDIHTANEFLSLLGAYPEDWPVPVTFESFGRTVHKVIRLEGVTPPMRQEYVVPKDVNRRSAERAIRLFREAVLGPGRSKKPGLWRWTTVRIAEGGEKVSYRISDGLHQTMGRVELDADGGPVRRIESDGEGAFWREGAQRYSVGPEESLYCEAMWTLRRGLLGSEAVWEKDEVDHVGSDALVTVDESGRISHQRALEAISIPRSEHVTVRVSFELDTHLPARLLARDGPTGLEVEVELGDYRQVNGLTWPHRLSVRSGRVRFEETVFGMEVEW